MYNPNKDFQPLVRYSDKKDTYFVISDIHSYFVEMGLALDEAKYNMKDSKLVVLGDIFDRGGAPDLVLDFLLKVEKYGNLIYVLGNHDLLLIDRMNGIINETQRINGTLRTYSILLKTGYLDKAKAFFERHMCFAFETQNYIMTHGWIPFDYFNRIIHYNEFAKSTWCYTPVEISISPIFSKTLVIGHWNSSQWNTPLHQFDEFADYGIFKCSKFIAIDACTATSRKVNVLILED